jgi:hypothetical protein
MSHIVRIENDRASAVLIMQASRHSKFAEFVRRPGLLLALCLYTAFLNLSFFDTLSHCLKFVRQYEIVRQCLIHWDNVSLFFETVRQCLKVWIAAVTVIDFASAVYRIIDFVHLFSWQHVERLRVVCLNCIFFSPTTIDHDGNSSTKRLWNKCDVPTENLSVLQFAEGRQCLLPGLSCSIWQKLSIRWRDRTRTDTADGDNERASIFAMIVQH